MIQGIANVYTDGTVLYDPPETEIVLVSRELMDDLIKCYLKHNPV